MTKTQHRHPTRNRPFRRLVGTGLLLASAWVASAQAAQVNVLCSMNPEWCRSAAAVYERLHGVSVSVINKPTGESYAQIVAEKERPRVDVWFGGTADPHFQAAEQGLLAEYILLVGCVARIQLCPSFGQ